MRTKPLAQSSAGNRRPSSKTLATWLVLCVIGALLSASAQTALAAGVAIARAVIALGTVPAPGAAGSNRVLQRHDAVYEGDTLTTSSDGRAQFTFTDGGRLALRPATQLAIEAYRSRQGGLEEKVAMRLVRGGFRTVTGQIGRINHMAYRMSTPYAVIGIRGTDWAATLEPGDSGEPILLIGVNEGGVTVVNTAGTLDLGTQAPFNFAQVLGPQQPPQGLTAPPPALASSMTSDIPPPLPPPPPIATSETGEPAAAAASDQQPASSSDQAVTTTTDSMTQPDVVFQYGTRCL